MAVVSDEAGRDVVVFDTASGEQLARLVHADEVFAVAYSPDGSRLATSGRDQVIHIWDSGGFSELVQLRGHRSYVWSLAWSPDGSRLASGSGDYTVRIWSGR